MPLRTFRDAVCIVTGGASGIGRALSEELARRGAHVVIADLQTELAAEVAQAIAASGGQAEAHTLDVTDAEAFDALVGSTMEQRGRLDYLFNNAGLAVGGEVKDYTLDDWRLVLDVDLYGVVYGVHAAYPRMVEQGFGHICSTASVAGLGATPMATGYCAAKHGVVGLSTSLRAEAEAYGVEVSVLCPGVVRTAILQGGGRYGRMTEDVSLGAQAKLWNRMRPTDVDTFIVRVLDDVARNKPIIVHPRWWRVLWALQRWSPALGRVMARQLLGETRRLLEEDRAAQKGPASSNS